VEAELLFIAMVLYHTKSGLSIGLENFFEKLFFVHFFFGKKKPAASGSQCKHC
jgi:hypothetical protein